MITERLFGDRGKRRVTTLALAVTVTATVFLLWQSDEPVSSRNAASDLRGPAEPDGFVVGGQYRAWDEQGNVAACARKKQKRTARAAGDDRGRAVRRGVNAHQVRPLPARETWNRTEVLERVRAPLRDCWRPTREPVDGPPLPLTDVALWKHSDRAAGS